MHAKFLEICSLYSFRFCIVMKKLLYHFQENGTNFKDSKNIVVQPSSNISFALT